MSKESQSSSNYSSYFILFLVFLVGFAIWHIPIPEGLNAQGWHLFAIFVATIIGIIFTPLPTSAMALLSLTASILTGTITIQDGLSEFSSYIIWLVVFSFFISRAVIKSGLGSRIGYYFVALLGKKTLGLSYGLTLCELILAPVIPSNTARSGGVILPILRGLAQAYDSKPNDKSSQKIGAYLTQGVFQTGVVISGMFLTSMAANPLAAKIAGEAFGLKITWGLWFQAAIVPGLICLILTPLFLYKFYPPELKETPEAQSLSWKKLEEMGKLKKDEWITAGGFLLLILLWGFGNRFGIHATTAALVGLCLFLVTRTLTWSDIQKESGAWDTLVWLSILVMLANFLNKYGVITWFSSHLNFIVDQYPWYTAFVILAIIYFYSHYFFASNTAHLSAMYATFVGIAISCGAPPMIAALSFAFMSNMFGGLTHYSTGPAAVLYSVGFCSLKDWWKFGFLVSIINLIVFLGIGPIWWKILGLW
ncbi:MAG: anion permease [Silvanigrellaceae bacterium]|nr:anion permease [Silvanigrellaceae bacterium]